jgi:hypothetical protein
LWIVEVYGGGLHLSKVWPSDLRAEWTRQIVPPTGTYQGVPDTCIHRGKLYLMWNRQDSNKLTDKREHRTRLVLRPYEDGKFTGLHVFENCPSKCPYGPSINTFDDRLILLWSDIEGDEATLECEPLYCTFFDGQRFSDSIKVNGTGRSRYAKGVQLGDSFYCVYKCNSQYPKSGYMYHDLALTRIGPGGKSIQTTYWVKDVKYNSSPDMCRMGDELYAVFGKFEHLYGLPDDPATDFGTFWGKLAR